MSSAPSVSRLYINAKRSVMKVAIMRFISDYYIFFYYRAISEVQKPPYPVVFDRDTLFTFNIMQAHDQRR